MIAYSVLQLVGSLAGLIGVLGMVLSIMVPPIALAAAAAGITSGAVTLSTGTAALSFAVPAITTGVGWALTRIGGSGSNNIVASIQRDFEKSKENVLKPEMIKIVQEEIAKIIGDSELIKLGVIEFSKQKGKEPASAK
jgi:uncharacterized membrane protein